MKDLELVVATFNDGKTRELQMLLGGVARLQSLRAFPGAEPAEEDGATFHANAEKKARQAARFTKMFALADDSGLEVDALGGAPGVYSARFAGARASDRDNVRALLERMRDVPPKARHARFRCVLALADPAGNVWFSEGSCEGRIAEEPRGSNGFGYDPVFIPEGETRTFGELPPEVKDAQSHRGRAVEHMRQTLSEHLPVLSQR